MIAKPPRTLFQEADGIPFPSRFCVFTMQGIIAFVTDCRPEALVVSARFPPGAVPGLLFPGVSRARTPVLA